MIVDGRKVACATCIKGHRASHCQHKDRQLIEIKKKGRPATQCARCRELRLVRQLHVRCDCNDIPAQLPARSTKKPKKMAHSNLRTIAPKPKLVCACSSSNNNDSTTTTLPSPPNSDRLPLLVQHQQQLLPPPPPPPPPPPLSPPPPQHRHQEESSSCCSTTTSSSSSAFSPELGSSSHTPDTTPASPCVLSPTAQQTNPSCSSSSCCSASNIEHAPPSSPPCKDSCCGSRGSNSGHSVTNKEKNSDRVRVITCRCGDSCACPGCDAHPSRAMKSTSNPYVMMMDDGNSDHPRRQLSIAAICASSSASPSSEEMDDTPSALLGDVGICNCGCSKLLQDCSGCCLDDYCQVGNLR